MEIIRAFAVVGSLFALLKNRLGIRVATRLGSQEISCVRTPDRRMVVLGHDPIAGYARDVGAVASESDMLALHTFDSTALIAEPVFIAPGDSCTRTDDPGWRWHCITGHGTTLAQWERLPMAELIEEIRLNLDGKIGSSALDGYATTEDLAGKQDSLPNAAALALVTSSGGLPRWDGGAWPGGGGGISSNSFIAMTCPLAWYSADNGTLTSGGVGAENGETVATWQDQSGNGYHLTGTGTFVTAAHNGLPSIQTNGTTDYYICSSFPAIDQQNHSVLAVFRQLSANQTRTVAFVFGASGAGAVWASTDRCELVCDGADRAWTFISNTSWCGIPSTPSGAATPFGVWTAIVANTTVSLSRNQVTFAAGYSPNSTSLPGLLVGAEWDSGVTNPTDLELAEVVIFSRPINAGVIGLITELLQEKWMM